MLLYVYDFLFIYKTPDKELYRLGNYFTLNPGPVGSQKIYLGVNISHLPLPNGVDSLAVRESQ